MFVNMVRDWIIRANRSGQDERQGVLTNRVTGFFFRSCFRPGISEALKTEGCLVIVRRLFGVAHIKLDVIGALEREKIFFRGWRFLWGCNRCWHGSPSC